MGTILLKDLSNPNSGNFRLSNWGDTHEDVFNIEGMDYTAQNEKIILYDNRQVMGISADISYSFKYSRLFFRNNYFQTSIQGY